MKILFHSNHLGIRGTEVALFDYANSNQTILGNESVIAYDRNRQENVPQVIEKFQKHFPVHAYADFSELDGIIGTARCDRAYFIKAGNKDGKVSNTVPTLVHAVFAVPAREVHGTVFAFVSEWLSKFASNGSLPYVPHMVNLPQTDEDLRQQLNIPKDALVIASYGGEDAFNVPFVPAAIAEALQKRRDLVFLFMNYPPFLSHQRAIFLPGNPDAEFKTRFINTSDAMIHAQRLGESFGLACGEFSSRQKPVITFRGSYGRSHIEILGDKALLYNNKQELVLILLSLSKQFIGAQTWDQYSKPFAPGPVMEKFKSVFLDAPV
ncbi:MAG TPA: hypothetical protein VEU95_06740 [Micropepsaceae bacterium]|jgi:hypothetical protein|nr:hypothetical protein [Micropepsaceae bacterium]